MIAVKRGEDIDINPDPNVPLRHEEELVLIGSAESEKLYNELYPTHPLTDVSDNSGLGHSIEKEIEAEVEHEAAEHVRNFKR